MSRTHSRFGSNAIWCAICLACLFTSGCSDATQSAVPFHETSRSQKTDSTASAIAVASPRKVIFTARVDLTVEDLSQAEIRFNQLLSRNQQSGGYVVHQEIRGTTGSHRNGSWTIRVPQSEFDQFIEGLKQLGEIQQDSRDAQDVSEAYADLESRLRNKHSTEQRLLGHLDKTQELKDTLEVERELSRVRGEVEQLQGQLDLLKNKTDLATVILTVYERLSAPMTSTSFGTQIRRTIQSSSESLCAFLRFLALFSAAIVPWLTIVIPIGWIVWKRRRNSH